MKPDNISVKPLKYNNWKTRNKASRYPFDLLPISGQPDAWGAGGWSGPLS